MRTGVFLAGQNSGSHCNRSTTNQLPNQPTIQPMTLTIVSVLLPLFIIGLLLQRWRMLYRKQKRLRHLQHWGTQSAMVDPIARQWLQQLPPAQLEVLLDLLHGYCASLNWELDWLFAPQLHKAPALHAALEESVAAYLRVLLLSLQMTEDVQAYQLYLAFDKQPHAHRQRLLVQQLYARLHHQRVPPKAQGFFSRFSRASARHQDQVAVIRQAFAADPARAMAALKAVLAAEQAASQSYVSPMPAASTTPIGPIQPQRVV